MAERDLEGWTIAFDLDGTLVETAPDLIGTLNRMLTARGLPSMPVEAASHLVGHGALALLRHGFMEAGAAWDEANNQPMLEEFITDYTAHIADHSLPYPGVIESLDRLAARGAILCVATNKRSDMSDALIEALGMTRHFAGIFGPDRVSARKPDGAHVREAVEKSGGDPARAIMVGDGAPDTQAAKAAGVPSVVVSFGYTPIPAAELGGDVLIDRFDELDAAVNSLIARR
ncbi:HAD-IA family hydrolase [Brevundimonas lenta]|uniref:Phosphoglycolate phosphatase n=1 Tax=Brevundimonas lenta TaxID=424796 RepID=A0A7W6JDH7_9CAUL|nr:HAD-IA family hydrolase [Brevundimonas lenta]MBB4083123.1 phosphoglycolate phosphatase [Brevundimonas lenta]